MVLSIPGLIFSYPGIWHFVLISLQMPHRGTASACKIPIVGPWEKIFLNEWMNDNFIFILYKKTVTYISYSTDT